MRAMPGLSHSLRAHCMATLARCLPSHEAEASEAGFCGPLHTATAPPMRTGSHTQALTHERRVVHPRKCLRAHPLGIAASCALKLKRIRMYP